VAIAKKSCLKAINSTFRGVFYTIHVAIYDKWNLKLLQTGQAKKQLVRVTDMCVEGIENAINPICELPVNRVYNLGAFNSQGLTRHSLLCWTGVQSSLSLVTRMLPCK